MSYLKQLFLNGVQADFDQDTAVAFTYQAYNPLVPDAMPVSYTNRVKIPLTPTNKALIGYVDTLNVVPVVTKTLIPVRYTQEGVELIPNGYCVVSRVVKNEFAELILFATEIDMLTKMKNKYLYDLDYTDIQFEWSAVNIETKRAEAYIGGGAGEVFPLIINLGLNILNNAGTIEYIHNYAGGSNSWVPISFGYRQILQRMINQNGFQYNWGKLKDGTNDNPKFNNTAVLQKIKTGYQFQYSDKFNQSVNFGAEKVADATYVNIGNGAVREISFEHTTLDPPSGFWNSDWPGAATSQYRVTNAATGTKQYFTGTFRFKGIVQRVGAGAAGQMEILLNGVAQATYVLASGDNNVDLSWTLGLANSDIVSVQFKQTTVNPTTVTVKIGCTFSFDCKGGPAFGGTTTLLFNQVLPEMTQLAFFKEFLLRFGQVPKFDRGTAYFKALKEILEDTANAIDWSDKVDPNYEESEMHLTQLGQRTWYTFQENEDSLDSRTQSGYFDIDDLTLNTEKVFESVFSAGYDNTTQQINCAEIKVQSASKDQISDRDTGARLLLTRLKLTYEPAIRFVFANPTYTNYVIGCFFKQNTTVYERSTSWKVVLEEWYSASGSISQGFLARLKNARWVNFYMKLTTIDIKSIDPHKPITIKGGTYMFPKVANHQPGKISKVTLLKL